MGDCLKLFVEMLKPVVEHAEKERVLLLMLDQPADSTGRTRGATGCPHTKDQGTRGRTF